MSQSKTSGPDRPVLVAPLMPLALAVVAGIALDRFANPWETSAWMAMAAVFGVVAILTASKAQGIGAVAILGAWAAFAGGWHHIRWSDLAPDHLARGIGEAPRPAWVRGVIRDGLGFRAGSRKGDQGITRAVLDLTAVSTARGWQDASGLVLMTVVGNRSDLRAGDAIEAAGNLAVVARARNPGEFQYRNYLRAQGTWLRLMVDDPKSVWASDGPSSRDVQGPLRTARRWLGTVKQWSKARLENGLGPHVAPLAAALVLGRREGVDPEVNDAFVRTGTTHLLAISGLHMQVLALAIGGLLRLLGVGRKPSFAAVGLSTVAYMFLVGLMPSVVRSAAMTATYCVAGVFDRKWGSANTLAAAALITLGLNPADLFDVGCQLSFLAVAAIVWGAVPLGSWLVNARTLDPLTALERRFEPCWKRRVRKLGNALVQGALVSMVVWLAALPLVALRFHLISPIGIVLNLPLIPLTSLALLFAGTALALAAVCEPLGRPFALLGSTCLEWTESIVKWGVARDWGHTFVPEPRWGWVLGFYIVLGLSVVAIVGRWRWPGRKGAVGISLGWAAAGLGLAVAPTVSARPGDPPRAEVLAVGHGLAVVIETGGGHALLYDCGRLLDPSVGRRVVAPALWARGIHRLDAVILSHADADHYNGLPDLLDRVSVSSLLVSPGFLGKTNPGATELLALARSKGVAVRTIAAGASWSAGETKFVVRHPDHDMSMLALSNAMCIVLDVSWRGRHALLTGDLDGVGLLSLTDRPLEGPVDVLLAPHHGGRTANTPQLYDWAKPGLVVVSQRPPAPGSRDPLDTLKVPVLRTWKRGAIRLTWTPQGIKAQGFLDQENTSADDADKRR